MIRGGLGALPGPLGKPRASGDDPVDWHGDGLTVT